MGTKKLKVRARRKNVVNLTPAQYLVYRNYTRFNYICGGRRSAKSVLLRAMLMMITLTFKQPYNPLYPPVVVLVCPTLKQAKAVHWRSLVAMFEDHPAVDRINNADLIIHMKSGLPDVYVLGLNDKGESIRGLKIYAAFIDEFQDCPPSAFTDIIRPAMADTPHSSMLAIGTPKGKSSFFYKVHSEAASLAKEGKPYAAYHFTTYDNPYVPREEIESAKLLLPPRIFRQEFLASWEDFEGGIFSSFTEQCIEHNQYNLYEVPARFMGVDWGDLNPAVVVIGGFNDTTYQDKVQGAMRATLSGRRYVILDYWKNSNRGMAVEPQEFLGQIKYLADKWRPSKIFCDPSEPGNIMTVRKMTGVAGTVKAYNRVREGNMIVNTLFHQRRLHVLGHLEEVIADLTSYHRAIKNGEIMEYPEDGQPGEHLSDCVRYVTASLEHKHMGMFFKEYNESEGV